jgi:hypothetical protein
MPHPDEPGDVISIEALRPSEWLASTQAFAGAWVEVVFDELPFQGPAMVLEIAPAPTVADGSGCVVLMTVSHDNNAVVELYLDDSEVLEPTFYHRFWSADREDWVPAGELVPGEQVATRDGVAGVAAIVAKPGTHRVFNFEVEQEHTYFVGESGAWVHNACDVQLFRNLFPEDVGRSANFALEQRGSQFFLRGPNGRLIRPSGSYNFVTNRHGSVVLSRSGAHFEIASGDAVRFAGEIRFTAKGQLDFFTNASGHYRPDPTFAFQSGLPLERFQSVFFPKNPFQVPLPGY